VKELRYACRLADEAGVFYGSFRDGFSSPLLAFELDSGDIVFCTFDTTLANTPFPRRPTPLENDAILAKAIEQRLSQAHPA
jgi:hypothetical protein